MAQDMMVGVKEGTEVTLNFRKDRTRCCRTSSARTPGINWCIPQPYLPVGRWWEKLEDICTYKEDQILYLPLCLNTSSTCDQGVGRKAGVFLQCSVPSFSPNFCSIKAIHSSRTWATLWLVLSPDQAQKSPPPSPHPQNDPIQTSLLKGRGEHSALFLAGDYFQWKPHSGCLPSFHFSKGAEASLRK